MNALLNILISVSLTTTASEAPSVKLDQAVSAGDVASVRLGLDKGVDPNRKNPPVIHPLDCLIRSS